MTAQDLTALADKLDELAELAMKAAASPLSFSPQNGAAGHCMVAQVWNEAGDSVAQFDPSENDQCATALAELFTLAVNNRPTLTTALREAARLREALEPFAAEAATYDADDDTDTDKLVSDQKMLIIESIDGTLSDSLISVGDFRRARAALESPHGA